MNRARFFLGLFAALAFSQCCASVDFACRAKSTEGEISLAKLYVQGSDDEEFFHFRGKATGFMLYTGETVVDLKDAFISHEGGWAVVREKRKFIIAFRRSRMAVKSPSEETEADLKFILRNGRQAVFKAKCFTG